jgi:hypothetical protein
MVCHAWKQVSIINALIMCLYKQSKSRPSMYEDMSDSCVHQTRSGSTQRGDMRFTYGESHSPHRSQQMEASVRTWAWVFPYSRSASEPTSSSVMMVSDSGCHHTSHTPLSQ